MPSHKQEAYRALELLEQYRTNLERQPGSEELQEALTKAIVAIRSRLFQALLDIQDFYEVTLENAAKPVEVKAEETRRLTEKWEDSDPPIPVNVRRLAQHTIAPSVHNEKKKEPPKSQSPGVEDILQPPQNIREDTVIVAKEEGQGLGLSVAGGTDNPHAVGETGIFVTRLTPGSPAEQTGLLQLGDQLLSVNEMSLIDVTHNEAVDALRNAGLKVTLRIRRFLDRVWSPASIDDVLDEPPIIKEHTSSPPPCRNIIEIFLNKQGRSLGFSIAGGRGNQHVMNDDGIFVTKITEGGVADQDGKLEVGDRVLSVNGQSMVDIDHEDAVTILKSTGQEVVLKVEKNAIGIQSDGEERERSLPPPAVVSSTPEEKAKVLSLLLQAPSDQDIINKPRIITLERPEGVGLGFNIIGGEEEVGIFISVISKEGLAAQDGQLRVGDMILEVNEQNLENWSHETAAQALKTAGNVVTLKVVYKPEEFEEFYRRMNIRAEPVIKQLYVRALFSYDASSETDRPGEGVSFQQGDILHVLNGSDEEWWQACLVGPTAEDGPQGLIPSKQRLEKKARVSSKSVKFGEPDDKRSNSVSSKIRTSFKLKKLGFGKRNSASQAATTPEGTDEPQDEEIPSFYEPVSLKKRGYARPVIVLGPLKEDINDKLVNDFPDKFAGCIPHTTRKPRQGEADGRDYHFVTSVEQMERDIQAHLFIEAGRYKDNLYGTSIQAVREVAEQNKHCILGVSGYAIKRLHLADLLPIAICIQPDNAQVIKNAQPRISDENAQVVYDKGRGIQQDFADSFTAIVTGHSLDDIYEKVKQIIHDNSSDLIWVPSNEEL